MRRGSIKKYCAAALFACCLLLLCGCAWIGQALDGLTPDETEAPAATKAPEITEAPEAVLADNPVFAFLSEFYRAYRQASNGLLDSVLESGDEKAASLYMSAMRDSALLSEVYSTIGMLSEEDGTSAFSGTFTGAYAGQGRLTFINTFSYVFDSGAEIRGSLKDGALRFDITEGDKLTSVALVRAKTTYFVWITGGEETGAAEIRQGFYRYTRFKNSLLADSVETEFPKVPNAPVLMFIGGELTVSE
ncbi:MAG: hypothetical protein K6G56_04415 [Clostridiales bacterium]|nr:hypothetical protein [Clostridiales bacterium]